MRKPPNEKERLARLGALHILDANLSNPLESVTALASQSTGCSVAYISFIEDTKQLFRATSGITIKEIPREYAVCNETLLSDEPLIISDISIDSRFCTSPLCKVPYEIKFYAGFPLITKDHLVLGTLCVAHPTPCISLTAAQIILLKNLSQYVLSQLELHNKLAAVQRTISSLEDSEQRFRRIADASPVLLWISDEAGNRTLSNKAWCDFTGLSQEESLADCWRNAVHPDDRNVYRSKWKEVSRAHHSFQHEYRLRHTSGTYRWVMEQAIPLFSSSGRLEAYVASCVDLSLRSSDELQYQHNEARFRAISEAAPLGIVVTDSSGNCIYSNHRFQEISGLSTDECLGSGWLRQIHSEDYQDMSSAWTQANKSAQPFEHILRYCRPNDTISWCSLKAATINATDTVSGWVLTIEDITAKRAVEEELRNAKKNAEAAMLAKSQFLANMSHEIRTPLTAIIGFADVLRDESNLAPSQRHCLDVILSNGRHLLNIINQILDLSKMDAGALRVEHAPCALVDLIEEVRLMFAPTAAEKSIALNIDYQWPLPRIITTDPLRLKQILINLIGNAVKFTSVGTVTIHVSWNKNSKMLSCAITDTGIGLTDEQIAQLFTPFYQANESTTRAFGGTGLGLSISERIIRALGGTIRVESTFGMGSQFSFSISCEAAEGESELSLPSLNQSLPINSLNPMIPMLSGSVLFADDALDNRRLVEHLLRKTGASITLVENGEQAARLATSEQFDLILMDIQMPIVDGLTATRLIRAAGVKTPVIALSAGAMTSDIEQALEAGCTLHLSKPFDRHVFYDMMRRYLQPLQHSLSANFGHEVIQSTIGAHDTEMQELLKDFVLGLPKRIRLLSESIARHDWNAVSAQAHKLKGSAGMYGFPALASIASRIDIAAKTTNSVAKEHCEELTLLIPKILRSVPCTTVTPAGSEQQTSS